MSTKEKIRQIALKNGSILYANGHGRMYELMINGKKYNVFVYAGQNDTIEKKRRETRYFPIQTI